MVPGYRISPRNFETGTRRFDPPDLAVNAALVVVAPAEVLQVRDWFGPV
jgi:hypothetical protein